MKPIANDAGIRDWQAERCALRRVRRPDACLAGSM